MTSYLTNEGFEVKQGFRRDQVAEQIEGFSPDLVILDVLLPGKDGFSLCRDIRVDYCFFYPLNQMISIRLSLLN